MTREIAGVQKPTVKYAASLGWLCWKMKIEGRNGCPDYWFFRCGVLIIVEFKAPGKDRKKQQELRAKDLKEKGFDVFVIDNVQDGRDLIDRFTF